MTRLFKTIGTRITSVVVILIIFTSIVGGVALFGLNTLTAGANDIIKQNEDLVFVFRAQVKIADLVRAEKDFVLTGEQKFVDEHTALRADILSDLEAAKERLETDVERERLDEILAAVDQYDQSFAEIKAARLGQGTPTVPTPVRRTFEGTPSAATTTNTGLQTETGFEAARELTQTSSNVLAAEMNSIIAEIVKGREDKVKTVGESANASSRTVQTAEVIVLVVAIVAGIILAFILVRSTTGALQDGITRVRDAIALVVDYTNQITTQRQNLDQIVAQVSDSTTKQSKLVEENSKTMTEMSASIQQTATNSKSAADTTAEAAKLAQQGTEAGKEAAERLKTIDTVVQENTNVVKDVDEKADEVTGIVDTINAIAAQVNLLALNAAIEAARAGEAGRGFAVVADEVRKLAEQATEATGKTADVVKAVKTAAATALEGLQTGTAQVGESTKIVNNALGILDKITAGAQEITAKAQEISTANQQQTASAQQLTGALQEVASSAEQNTASAQQATVAATTVAEVVEKAVAQTDALTQVADELQALIGAAKAEIRQAAAATAAIQPVANPEETAKERVTQKPVTVKPQNVQKREIEKPKVEPTPIKPKVEKKTEVEKPTAQVAST